MTKQIRFVNSNRTVEHWFPNEWDLFWGYTEEEMIRLGWVKSDEPLITSDIDCVYCEGSGKYQTLSKPQTLHIKCKHCDGTGKQLKI